MNYYFQDKKEEQPFEKLVREKHITLDQFKQVKNQKHKKTNCVPLKVITTTNRFEVLKVEECILEEPAVTISKKNKSENRKRRAIKRMKPMRQMK